MDSILISIKKMLGIDKSDDYFNSDIIMHINSVFMILHQIGVGPESGFSIQDETTTWYEYISDDNSLEAVKSYMYLKVKLLFDPPASSVHLESINKMISELEWRLNSIIDYEKKEV